MTKTKTLQAVLLILEKDGKILYGKRAPDRESLPGRWSLPSDKIEKGETLEKAARRCAMHELGLNIRKVILFNTYHFKDEKEDKTLNFIKAVYDDIPKICDPRELTELEFYSFEDFFKKHKDEEIGHGLQYLRRKFYSNI